MEFTTCKCTPGRMADNCPADLKDAGIQYYLGKLDDFAAEVRAGAVTMEAIKLAEVLMAELDALRDQEVSCLSVL